MKIKYLLIAVIFICLQINSITSILGRIELQNQIEMLESKLDVQAMINTSQDEIITKVDSVVCENRKFIDINNQSINDNSSRITQINIDICDKYANAVKADIDEIWTYLDYIERLKK